ncbi:MAG TPA: CaiB/BaiF CoA-transferase family protein [Roseomonas sp.]|jgi:crotonobetainyl-CoA:carnitine CoA-transferase CaiB-like acyl-CoA transferase
MAMLLEGVRVLDLTNVIAGPLCSLQLAMLGAEVIKVEVPGSGDLSRKLGTDLELGRRLMGTSFLAMNAGKKSLTLNLKHPRGKALFLDLVRGADVVFENFRPGTMQRLGLGYDDLKPVNPALVYCAVSGFGQDGPLSQRPSYDQIIQGFSGLMSVTGTAESAPLRAGYVVCDSMAAIVAAFAIAAALFKRARTGEGEMIDVSMLDASLSTMAAWAVSNVLNAGLTPRPVGNENPTSSPSGTFRTGDGQINIVCNEEKQFHRLCEAIGLPELLQDARFNLRPNRLAHRGVLRELLEAKLAERSSLEWEAILTEAGVPVGPILSLPEMLAHPHVAARELIRRFPDVPVVEREIGVTRPGFHLASGLPDVARPPPVLGEDTEAILGELGLSAAEIADLRKEGAI